MSYKGVRVSSVILVSVAALSISATANRAVAQTDLYVTNVGSDDVLVVDTVTDQVKATIPVGDDPDGIAVLPSGAAIYVANFLGDNVSVIDPSEQAVVRTIPVGSGPVGVAASGDSQRVYVANRESNTVSVIDTAEGRVIANVQVDEGPNGVAVRPDGGVIYVTNSFTHSPGVVSVIDASTNRVIDAIAVNHSPGRVAFSPDGEVAYVTNYRSHNVSIIDARSHDVVATVPVAGRATNVAVTPNGQFVYVTTLGGRINVIETSQNSLYANILVGVQPYSITVLPSGERAYTADLRSDTSSIVDTVDHVADGQIAVGQQPFAVAVRCVASNCAAPPLTPRPTRTPTPSASITPTTRPTFTIGPTSTFAPTRTPRPTIPPVVIRIGSNSPDANSRAGIQVTIEGSDVGGFQNDIIFDNTVLGLEERDCVINAAIGFAPLGPPPAKTCGDDPAIGPCKTLLRDLENCGEEPLPQGCPSQDSTLTRFRAIVAATGTPNDNLIPSGMAYTCTFRVLDPDGLPSALEAVNVVVSDPLGTRLESVGIDGRVLPSDRSSPNPLASAKDAGGGCSVDPISQPRVPWYLFIALPFFVFRRLSRERSGHGRSE